MIASERQYRITRNAAERFRKTLEGLEASQAACTNVHPRLLRAEREGMESVLADLQAELAEYERRKAAG